MSKKNQIIAAMSAPDEGVTPSRRTKSSSFAAAVADLEVGESASRAMQIEDSHDITTIRDNMQSWRTEYRNACTPAVKRAKERNVGAEYTLEVADVMTHGYKLYLVAIVTRTA